MAVKYENVTLKRIIKTCSFCPEQYEGILSNNVLFYVRCRWGYGEIRIFDGDVENCENNSIPAVKGETVSEIVYDDNFSGVFDDGDLIKLFNEIGVVWDGNYIDENSLDNYHWRDLLK
jgi:hypothetical protein